MDRKAISFFVSADINAQLRVRIAHLEGSKPVAPFSEVIKHPQLQLKPSNVSNGSDLMASVQVWSGNKALTLPVTTLYKPFRSSGGSSTTSNSSGSTTTKTLSNGSPFSSDGGRRWNEWLCLPIRISQLPLDACIAITILDFDGKSLVPYAGTTTPIFHTDTDCTIKTGRHKLKLWLDERADPMCDTKTPSQTQSQSQTYNLQTQSHTNAPLTSTTTTATPTKEEKEMDRLERLLKLHEQGDIAQIEWLDRLAFRKIESINKAASSKTGDNSYLYIDFVRWDFPLVCSEVEYPPSVRGSTANATTTSTSNTTTTTTTGGGGGGNTRPMPSLTPADPASAPITVYVSDEMSKVHDPEATRENPIESKYRRLVRTYRSSQVDRELKPNAKIRDELHRIMAYSPVHTLTEEEKNLLWKFRFYLTKHNQTLTKFLKAVSWEDASEAKQAVDLLHQWAEIDVADALELVGPSFSDPNVRAYAVERLKKASDKELQLYLLQLVEALKFEPPGKKSLAKFLIQRAVQNPVLGNFFYWYLAVESDLGGKSASIFRPVLKTFMDAVKRHPDHAQQLNDQITLMDRLLQVTDTVRRSREPRTKKIELLKSYLGDPKHNLNAFPAVPFPLNPAIKVVGCIPDQSSVFKSSLSPIKIVLTTDTGKTYPAIFKSGDDLRQDQLVIQIISLMDQLLLNENLDLKLTPYRILATNSKQGALQFVPNETLATVLAEYHGIIPFLRHTSPDPQTELGIRAEVLDTFIRSCAGYCVITYILGVGDRHLDNLLICPDGHFFHIDFGYILGRDPKPFPPLMKLPIQIVEAMGGTASINYERFCNYCFTAYMTLRKNANLILNLFSLMTHSSIPDIAIEKDKTVLKVKEKFCLEMSEEEAIIHFRNLINDSVNAFLPMVIDRLHSFAQYWRN